MVNNNIIEIINYYKGKEDDIYNIQVLNNWLKQYEGSIFIRPESSINDLFKEFLHLKKQNVKPIIVPTMHPQWERYPTSALQLEELLDRINEPINVVSHIDVNIGYLSSHISGQTGYEEKGSIPKDTRFAINNLFHKSKGRKFKLFTAQHLTNFSSADYNIVNLPIGFDLNHINSSQILNIAENYKDYDRKKLISSHHNMFDRRINQLKKINQHSDLDLENESFYKESYFESLSKSKYSLVMPGVGFDCFRVYEIIFFGGIPVVQHLNDAHGLKFHYEQLPILLVEDFYKSFPSQQELEDQYPYFCEKFKTFDKKLFTNSYWIKNFLDY